MGSPEPKHGWNELDNYLLVLRHVVDDDPFVISDTLSVEISSEAGDVSGDILCHGDVILDVTKHFEVDGRYARTVRYSYHARYANGQDILRYDNAHAREGMGHSETHHKHSFTSGEETITPVPEGAWPHLSDVLAELRNLIWK